MANYKDAKQAAETDGGMVKGYASTFDREPDCYGDVIAKGAFAKSIERWSASDKPVPLLYGHNTDDPKYNIGLVTLMKEDDRGLYVEAEFDGENETAQYVRKLVKEGRLYQFSFAFDCKDWAEVELEDGTKANELRELDIFEVSLVQIPANQHAEVVEVKSMTEYSETDTTVSVAMPEKSGKRNSKADADAIRQIEALAGQIDELCEQLLADEVEIEDEELTEGGEEDSKGREESDAILDVYKQAIIDSTRR